MTKPTTQRFGQFLIEVGDGGSPEVFSAPCGLTTKGFHGTASAVTTVVPDCDDPDAPAWDEKAVSSLSRDIAGSGILAVEFTQEWDDWFAGGLSKNCRITTAGFAWTGAYILTNFSIDASLGDKVKITVAMGSDGQITRAVAT